MDELVVSILYASLSANLSIQEHLPIHLPTQATMSVKPQLPTPSNLPKSTKVRSTCNACQQAKIRCSHEKPSCRRCQKHNIDCIYSMSRRLGRPAKRREGTPADQGRGKETPCRVQRRVKTGKRKTESDSHAQRQNTESKDDSIEDELRTPMLGEDSFSISGSLPEPLAVQAASNEQIISTWGPSCGCRILCLLSRPTSKTKVSSSRSIRLDPLVSTSFLWNRRQKPWI